MEQNLSIAPSRNPGSAENCGADRLRLIEVPFAQVRTAGTRREPDAGLRESMARYGLLEPIDLRARGDEGYELIGGSRRVLAARGLGWRAITAVVEPPGAAAMPAALRALLLNLHRESLQQLHLGRQAQRLLEEGDWTQAALARQLGIGRSSLCQMLAVLRCPDLVRVIELEGLEFGAAKRLASLPPPALQTLLGELRAIATRDGHFPPVRCVEARVRELRGHPPLPAFAPEQLDGLVAELAVREIPVEIETLPGKRSSLRVTLRLTEADAAALRAAAAEEAPLPRWPEAEAA